MTGRMRRLGLPAAAAGLCVLLAVPEASALQRVLRSKAHNYPNAPVRVAQSKVTLLDVFPTPTQAGVPDAGKSRVRYANKAGLLPRSYRLRGELSCANESGQTVEAIKVTVVVLDAFHQAVMVPGQRSAYLVEQIVEAIPRGAAKRLQWEQDVGGTSEVYEVAVVVTAVRFADGSVWTAPDEELIEFF
jgi:hypothetical protein